jgi:Ran GTPase-activating protein (RanGAP) involved in mRNA processing and transport
MYVNGFQKPGTLIRDISMASSELSFAVHVSIFSVKLTYNTCSETENTIKLVIFYVATSIQMDLEIMKLHPLIFNRLSSLVLMVSGDCV